MSAFELKIIGYFFLGTLVFGGVFFLLVFILIDILRACFCGIREKWIECCIEWYRIWWNNLKKDTYFAIEWLLNNTMNINNQEILQVCIMIKNSEIINENRGRKVGG